MKIAKFIAAVLCTPQNNLHCLSAKPYLQSEFYYCNQNFSAHKIYTFQNHKIRASRRLCMCRRQNSPYFCVFTHARALKQKVCNEEESRERNWGEVRLASFTRIRLLRHALPISLLILRKKPTVLQSTLSVGSYLSMGTCLTSLLDGNNKYPYLCLTV